MNIRYFVNYLRTMKCYMWFVGMQLFISLSIFVWVISSTYSLAKFSTRSTAIFKKGSFFFLVTAMNLTCYLIRHNHYIAFVMESILITFFAIEIMFRMIVQNKVSFSMLTNITNLHNT